MITVVLAAGYATRLYPLTENFPKPLLDVNGRSILDHLLSDIDPIPEISRHVVISNHRFIGHFESWRDRAKLTKPIDLLDDGTTSNETRLGAVRDVQFAIEQLALDDDLLVIAGDNLLDFSMTGFVAHFAQKDATSIMCYREPDTQVLRHCGVMVPDDDFKVVRMVEKPQDPPSHWAVPPFYIYHRRDLHQVARGVSLGIKTDAPGSFIAWLAGEVAVYAWPMPGQRYDVGSLESYRAVCEQFSAQ